MTIDKARSFIQLIRKDEVPSLELLTQRLDELVAIYHSTPPGDIAEEDPEPELGDAAGRYQSIASRFTDLGLYRIADPRDVDEEKSYVSDAIDDLADICRDLEEVLWRYERHGVHDAHWHFRLLFTIHWGRHARELSLYLHSRLYG